MKIDRILYPIETLGPGNRLVIWTKGCSKQCYKCANPELWSTSNARDITPEKVAQMVLNIHKETPIDGITISGGDPLEQADEVLALIQIIKPEIDDVLVYTGFCYREIKSMWKEEIVEKIETYISVLIDGPYIDAFNDSKSALVGSTNQEVIYFDEAVKYRYQEYLKEGRKVQNVFMGKRLISVGIHNRNEV